MSSSIIFGQALVNGLVIGMMYMLMAVGFTLVFGIMRVVNFAHGEFYMLGAFAGVFTYAQWQLPFVVCLAISALAVGLFGAVLERLILRNFRRDEGLAMIASLGLALVLQNGALLLWGATPRSVPDVVSGSLSVGPFTFSMGRLMVIAVAAVLFAAFWFFMQRTRIGRAMRAVAQDTETALVQGVRIERIYPFAFGLSVAFAAVAGTLMGPIFSVSPFVGSTPMLKSFVVVILGGLGSIPGAVLGALLLGVIESFTAIAWGAAVSDLLVLALVILILLVRPWGLLGQREYA
ncbi:MAG: branched-chain amino acid ABC transporter permease [Burkholderiaceae bacterium]|nr:branched-chain amino acid ABC transporter permease [Burkholderiaceae bacterium]